MINSYNNNSQIIDVNENLVFTNNRVLTGTTVTHAEGTAEFKLNRPGYYYVAFNGEGAMSDTAGDIVVQLLNNTEAVPGAIATEYSGAITETSNLSFSTIIKVLPSCCCNDNTSTLTFSNIGIEAVFSNVNVVITKLC